MLHFSLELPTMKGIFYIYYRIWLEITAFCIFMNFIYIRRNCKRWVLIFQTKNVNASIFPKLQILFQKSYSRSFNLHFSPERPQKLEEKNIELGLAAEYLKLEVGSRYWYILKDPQDWTVLGSQFISSHLYQSLLCFTFGIPLPTPGPPQCPVFFLALAVILNVPEIIFYLISSVFTIILHSWQYMCYPILQMRKSGFTTVNTNTKW